MNKTRLSFLLILLLVPFCLMAANESKARWIYYPGEFEIYIHNKLNMQRTERNQAYPTSWRLDPPYGIISFLKTVTLDQPENASLDVDGKYYISINGTKLYDFDPHNFVLPKGTVKILIHVANFSTFPSVLFKSKSIVSDESWTAVYDRNPAVGVSVYDSSSPQFPPSSFRLKTEPQKPQSVDKESNYVLYDFGKNTFGFPVLEGLKGNGKIYLYYGESKEEAMAEKEAEYTKLFANPYNAAKYGYIDDVIEPRNTRFRIIRALQQLQTKKLTNPAKKHGNIPL